MLSGTIRKRQGIFPNNEIHDAALVLLSMNNPGRISESLSRYVSLNVNIKITTTHRESFQVKPWLG